MEDYALIDRRIDDTKAFGSWLRQLIVDQGLHAGLLGVSLLGANEGVMIVSSEDEKDYMITIQQLEPLDGA